MSDQLRILPQNDDLELLSKTQIQFNTLTQKIEQQKAELTALQTFFDQLQIRVAKEIRPLYQQYYVVRGALVHVFDQAYQSGFFRRKELQKLSALIQELCLEIIPFTEDAALIQVYDQYADETYAEKIEAAKTPKHKKSKQQDEEIAEEEIDDDSFYDDYDSMQEQWKEEASRKNEKKSPSGKPKTAKQLEREAKRMTNAQKMSKSVKEVYTALVKAFHPDREMDETEKLRKTTIVQEVISAYEKNDLLTLLQLQLQFEQIDQSHLNNVAEEQLKYYTKILQKQSNQIQQELQAIEQQLRQYFSIPANQKISPAILDGMIVKDIKNIKKSIHSVREDLKLLQDPSYLQAFISHYTISDDAY